MQRQQEDEALGVQHPQRCSLLAGGTTPPHQSLVPDRFLDKKSPEIVTEEVVQELKIPMK